MMCHAPLRFRCFLPSIFVTSEELCAKSEKEANANTKKRNILFIVVPSS
jgi:hypothetical protein